MCNFLNFEKNKTINIEYVSRIFYIVILQLSIVNCGLIFSYFRTLKVREDNCPALPY